MILPSGQTVNLRAPNVRVVDEDLMPALQMQRRYAGQSPATTLLQHLHLCTLLARLRGCGMEAEAYAAAHDLHEVYIGDLIRAWKETLPETREIDHRWEAHVRDQVGLRSPAPAMARVVKAIDVRAVAIEATMGRHPHAERFRENNGGPINRDERQLGERVLNADPNLAWLAVRMAIACYVGHWLGGPLRVPAAVSR